HNFLDESGGECYCGRVGCVETILSGPNLERYYTSVSGTQRKLKEIVERHHEGIDAHATATMDRLIHFFGKAMGPIINILDPDAIVLGGGVSNIDLLYEQGVAEVEKYVFNPRMETRFLRPKLGDSAGVFGAAMLVV
ncbi:MAG: ROK family protein, partial [Bacteroidota bacterium]